MKNKKLIVFDMDGVLIDVSKSYRETTRQTVKLFFKGALSSEKLPEPLFSLAELAAVKQSGGLNNDWDLSCYIIKMLFSRIEKPPVDKSKNPRDRYREMIRQCDVTALAAFLKSTPSPLTTLLKKDDRLENALIDSLYGGDVGSGNIIKQIFQEIYLGRELFYDTYRLEPQFYEGDGLIHQEQLLIDKGILDELAADNILAIATGRPRAEANYPLNHFKIGKYFTKILALEDCLEEEARILKAEGKAVSLSKPDPFMLNAIAQDVQDPVADRFYIGDMPDDMEAARRTKTGYKSIGMVLSAPDKDRLKNELLSAGANHIIENVNQLRSLIMSSVVSYK